MRKHALFMLLLVIVAVSAQKGGTKRPRPGPAPGPTPSPGRPAPPAFRPSPTPQRPLPPRRQEPNPQEDEGSNANAVEEGANGESGPEPPAVVPETSFTCNDKPYDPGMYADMENECRSYHMCYNGKKDSFLCGTGTMFNQEILSCDHENKVNCDQTPNYYSANTELGKPGAEPPPGGQSGTRAPSVRPAPAPAPRPGTAPRPRPGQAPAPRQPGKTNVRPVPQPDFAPRPQQPRPQQPTFQPSIPAVTDQDSDEDDEVEEGPTDSSDQSSKGALKPKKPVTPPKPSKISPPKPALKPQGRPSKTNPRPSPPRRPSPPPPPRQPVEQSYIENEPAASANLRAFNRAFRVQRPSSYFF